MDLEKLKNKTIRSIAALIGRTIFLQIISLVAFFLLGIFLSPSAVGIFISVSALLRIFTFFTDLGLGAALVQKKDKIDNDDLKTTFMLQEIVIVLVVIVGVLTMPFVSRFANLESDGIFLYLVLIFTLFLSSLKAIPSILLERNLEFEKQIIPQIVESLVFNIMVVVLAFKGFGVASYSWAILISSLVGLPIYYYVSPWRISFGFSIIRAKKLFSYGLVYQGKNILAVIKDDLLTFFLTGIVGTSGVGYWGWAQRWAYSPFRLVVDSVSKVTFPTYSRVQNKVDVLGVAIEKSLFVVASVLFPILTILPILAEKAIILLPKYEKWQPAMPSFYFLCAGAAISAVSNILVNALDATGHVKKTLGLMVMWIILTWSLTLFLVGKVGFTGISMASFLVTLTIVVTIYLVKNIIRFSFLANVWQPILSCLIMGLTMVFLSNYLPISVVSIVILGMFGAIIYLTVLIFFAKRKLVDNLTIIIRSFYHE